MRIGLAGSGGTGKTELSRALSRGLKVSRIKDGVRVWAGENRRMQTEILEQKINQELATESYVADGTSIDAMACALRWLGREPDINEWMSEYVPKCLRHAVEAYDMIFVLPWGVFPADMPWYQLEIQLLIEGTILNHPVLHSKSRVVLEKSVAGRYDEIISLISSPNLR